MPSGYVVVYGHGGFTPSDDTPWFSVPEDTQVYFVTEGLKTLYMDTGEMMAEWSASDLEDNVVQWVSDSGTCWNYEVGPDDQALEYEGKIAPPSGVEFDVIHADERLESIVKRHKGKTVVMAACRVVNLKDAGGAAMGVNTRGMEVEGSDLIPSERLTQMRATGDANFKPQGVVRCVAVCPTCFEDCRWNEDHVGNYNHRCEQDHEWPDSQRAIGWDDIDMAVVSATNQQVLKSCEEGDSVPFWQAGSLVLLGEYWADSWKRLIERQTGLGGANGTVTMVSKGSLLGGAGELSVTGSYDAGEFEAALQPITKKDITFA